MQKLFKRENYLSKIRAFYHDADLIKVITGVRRCGKSSLMQIIKDEIIQSGVSENAIIYINLEETKYRKIKTADSLEELVQSKATATGLKYLFIDEVQNVNNFEEVLNGFRSGGEYSIFITGSNSYLLSGELMTKLTGRYIAFDCFPLTFNEWLQMHAFYSMELPASNNEAMNRYIIEGGFPRTVFIESANDKRTYVNALVNEIIEKDVYSRVKVKNRDNFRKLMMFIINNYSSPMSVRSITEAMNKAGIKISTATVSRYIKALCDAKIVYSCNAFDMKSKKSIGASTKYYLSDLSFYFALKTNNSINFGPSLENITYVYALHLGYSVSVGRYANLECDFIVRNNNCEYAYIQVCYSILGSKKVENREYRVLEKIKDNYPKFVLTMDIFLQKRSGIAHLNLADFMEAEKQFCL